MSVEGLRSSQGKGLVGCVVFIFLAGAAIFLAIRLGPIYYANYNLESELRTEVSRAGAHFLDDEMVTSDVLEIAKRNDIRLTKKNVEIERFAGQIHIDVTYSVPVDFVLFRHDMKFQIKVSSFVGTL